VKNKILLFIFSLLISNVGIAEEIYCPTSVTIHYTQGVFYVNFTPANNNAWRLSSYYGVQTESPMYLRYSKGSPDGQSGCVFSDHFGNPWYFHSSIYYNLYPDLINGQHWKNSQDEKYQCSEWSPTLCPFTQKPLSIK